MTCPHFGYMYDLREYPGPSCGGIAPAPLTEWCAVSGGFIAGCDGCEKGEKNDNYKN